MVFAAKYSTVCPCCNARIQRGEQVVWFKGSPAKHFTCPVQAKPVETLVGDDAFDLAAEINNEIAAERDIDCFEDMEF